jgi:uncharacterized protein (TIGR02145 family)
MKIMKQVPAFFLLILISLTGVIVCNSASGQEKGTFVDERDGKIYGWVKIGTQVWMSSNLNFKSPSGCWGYNNNPANADLYGWLYDWKTANNVCPKGWHLPADSEWTILVNFLGGDKSAGARLKEPGKAHWFGPNEAFETPSGFSAFGGGYRADEKNYIDIGKLGYYWASTVCEETYGFYRCMNFSSANVFKYCGNQTYAFSVRCIKDQ